MRVLRGVCASLLRGCLPILLFSGGLSVQAQAAEPLRDGEIGYVFTDLFWSVYQTEDGSEECPQGFNDGPREEFAALFPAHESRSVQATQLAQEALTWHPQLAASARDGAASYAEQLSFHTVAGRYARGLDLDGESSEEDFVHPDGTPGIDNQVYRAVGCIIGFRGPDGVEFIFQDKAIRDEPYNRMMLLLSEVESLEQDEHVRVQLYRGLDPLLRDASGERILPGGTQRIDRRWGASLIRDTTGRIERGVLRTEPIADLIIPWMNLSVPTTQRIRDARFELALTPSGAQGLLGGYADVDTWYYQLIRNDSTHHLSNGQISGISLYQALRRLADAYPDAQSGENTAISTALDVRMTQVYILDPVQP